MSDLSYLRPTQALLMKISSSYRNSKEYLTLTFEDQKSGNKYILSISAERGGDLVMKVASKK